MAQPSDVPGLLREASRADNYRQAQALVAAAEQQRAQHVAAVMADREIDLGNAIMHDHLTPVRVHEHHTAATGWLGEVDTSGGAEVVNHMLAEGSLWYSRLHEAVKSDSDEFDQQAVGVARRLAGAFGEQAGNAEEAFLTHVGTLRRREVQSGIIATAASGLPQVGDEGAPIVESGLGVAPAVPAGLDGDLTSSDRAPAMQAMEQNAAGTPSPAELPQANPDIANGDEGDRTDDRPAATTARRHGVAAGPGRHRVIADDHDPDAPGPSSDPDGGWHHKRGDVVTVQSVGTHGDQDGTVWAMVRHPRLRGEVSFMHPENLEPLDGGRTATIHQGEWWHDKDEQPLQVDPNNPHAAWNRWGNSPHWADHQEGYEHGFMTENRARPHDRSTGAGQAYHEGYDLGAHSFRHDLPRPSDLSTFTNQLGRMFTGHEARKGSHMEMATCPSCQGNGRVAVRRQGASGLDQIDQIVDSHDNPRATPYPEEVAFAWEMDPNAQGKQIQEAEQQIAQREKLKGASRRQLHAQQAAYVAAQQAYASVMGQRRQGGYDDSGWAGDMGAGGVRPGMQDQPGPGPVDSLGYTDPVYGQGGDQGDRDIKPYGADEANDYTNNPGQNWQPGQPTQADVAARPNVVGQPTAGLRLDDPEVAKALRFAYQRTAWLAGRS